MGSPARGLPVLCWAPFDPQRPYSWVPPYRASWGSQDVCTLKAVDCGRRIKKKATKSLFFFPDVSGIAPFRLFFRCFSRWFWGRSWVLRQFDWIRISFRPGLESPSQLWWICCFFHTQKPFRDECPPARMISLHPASSITSISFTWIFVTWTRSWHFFALPDSVVADFKEGRRGRVLQQVTRGCCRRDFCVAYVKSQGPAPSNKCFLVILY